MAVENVRYTEADLRPYQHRTIDFILDKKRCAPFLDMGMGKTVSALTAISRAQNQFEAGKAMVIAPLRVARNTWPKEIDKWDFLRGTRVSVVCGSLEERLAALQKDADFYVMNRENVTWLEKARDAYGVLSRLKIKEPTEVFKHELNWLEGSIISGVDLRKIFRYNKDTLKWSITPDAVERLKQELSGFKNLKNQTEFDAFIVDESSSFKNRQAKRWGALRRLSRGAKYVVAMTGTPRPNTMLEIHPQIMLLDGGERLGGSIVRFREAHFRALDAYGRKWALKKGHGRIITEKIADISMTLKSEDYLQLPPRFDEFTVLDLSADLRKKYEKFERDFVLKTLEGGQIEAVSAAALASKLMQLANGAIYDSEKHVHKLHDEKIEALKEIIEEADGAPVLVAYTFKHDLARLKTAFPQAVVLDSKPETEDRWNRGEIPILLAHPKSAGHGLNLQDGGSIAVWFGLTYSLEEYMQFNKRLHRSGQRRDVYIKHLLMRGTIDEVILQVLRRKDAEQAAMLQALIEHAAGVARNSSPFTARAAA